MRWVGRCPVAPDGRGGDILKDPVAVPLLLAPACPDDPVSNSKELEALLEYLKRTRGFDFSGYKRASLERRITKRMAAVGIGSMADYLDFLEVHPEEFAGLFNTVLINVTSFFRDASTWEFFAEKVVPEVAGRRAPPAPIRVWSAGCASGEEAYTLAMLFAEYFGVDAFKDAVKIYATDVDEDALVHGRQGVYSKEMVETVPAELRQKYFEGADGRFTFRKDLRRQVIFGRHDLIQDAPISRVDLLVCRNTLMYFNAETQAKILSRFHFALNDDGVLFLGRAETMIARPGAFAPIDLKRRLSAKVPNSGRSRERVPLGMLADASDPPPKASASLQELALDSVPTAQLTVDATGNLVSANERARVLFDVLPADLGRPLRDLKISYRPADLRTLLDQVFTDRRAESIKGIEWPSMTGDSRWLDVHVIPLLVPGAKVVVGASISFIDVSAAKRLQHDLEHANRELETAYEELQSTNEELETTNEELQSTIEELETTNEELQSTNEELETMNEELQSTNEELHTTNDELRVRSDDLNRANTFLESILSSLRGAVVVVDSELKVLAWNPVAEDYWGLREDEVRGRNVLGLDIGLPTERLKQPLRACIQATKQSVTLVLDAVNRRGRTMTCHVTISPLVTRDEEIHGAILLMEEDGRDGDRAGAGDSSANGKAGRPGGRAHRSVRARKRVSKPSTKRG
jgi:two-component system, chemotaxis family, CheB/CheR fusion protein